MPQYKVLSQQQGGRIMKTNHFSPEDMEAELNVLASEGWRVVNMALGAPPPFKHDVLVVLLERG